MGFTEPSQVAQGPLDPGGEQRDDASTILDDYAGEGEKDCHASTTGCKTGLFCDQG